MVRNARIAAAAALVIVCACAPGAERAVAVTAPDELPVAAFTIAGDGTPETGEPVPFDATQSVDPDGTIVAYSWNFGDRGHATGATPSHAYTAPGTYTVTLTVTDSSGQHRSVSHPVTVAPDEPPAATFITVTPVPVPAQPVVFDAGAARDPDGTITSYAWDFGDGTSGSGVNPSHTYAYAGAYTVQLTVGDSGGQHGTVRMPVIVHALPQSLFQFSPALILAGSPAGFDGTGSLDPDASTQIAAYRWSFGDGSTATGATVAHAYASAGTYTVALTVTNALGLSTAGTEQVTVADGHPAAAIAVLTPQPSPGHRVGFTGAGASSPTGATVTYLWRFGDGTRAIGRAASHTYARPGRYRVSLTVKDSSGATTVTYETVTVARPGHIAKLAVRPGRAGAALLVSVDTAGALTASARGTIRLRHAGTAAIAVRLTRAQLRAVRRGHRLNVRLRLRFTPHGHRAETRRVVVAFRSASGHVVAGLGSR